MFPRHFMRVGFSIRGRIGWRAVENCPIVPTDLTFHRYWTISYNSTFTLLMEQHWWLCSNLDFLWFVCLHQTQNVTHSCKNLLSLPLEKVKNNIAQGCRSISKTKFPPFLEYSNHCIALAKAMISHISIQRLTVQHPKID